MARGVRWAAAVVTPTDAVADEVAAEYGLPRASVRAVHLGIDPAWSATRAPSAQEKAALGLPAEYIVAVGTVEPRKNLPLLVSAHRLLPAAPPLVLVGDVRWAGEVARPSPRVHLTGYVPDEDLRRIVAGARVLAYPSRREGFGLPPLEALACGVPVVVSDLPVLREVLGEHARFVPVGDAEALAAGLASHPAAKSAPRRPRQPHGPMPRPSPGSASPDGSCRCTGKRRRASRGAGSAGP